MPARSCLVRPTSVFRDSYLAALREGHVRLDRRPHEDVDKVAASFDEHLRRLDRDGQSSSTHGGRTLPSVPALAFWLVRDGEFIGSVQIRARIDTPLLARFGGHVGYAIRPSKRRQGFGTRQLALALDVARGMGLGLARMSCAETNVGSRKIIETNGGILLRRGEPDWFVDEPYLLFEIPLV